MDFEQIPQPSKKEVIKELIADSKEHDFKPVEKAMCFDILDLINEADRPLTAQELSFMLQIEQRIIRKHIQLIRRYNSYFNKPRHFLIARSRGYVNTSDLRAIEKFFNKTQARYQNTTPQLLQMKLLLVEKEN